MTTLIQQKSGNDCVLASIAMAAGKEKWEDLWTPEDLQTVIDGKGISDFEPWMERAGFKQNEDYREMYAHSTGETVKAMLWRRRALVSVSSLNNEGGSHMVYWDGTRIWDPQDGVEGKLAHPFLASAVLWRVMIFKD